MDLVRALADVVATKLGFFLLLFLSFHLLFSQKGFAYDFEFLHAFLREAVKSHNRLNLGNHPNLPRPPPPVGWFPNFYRF